MNQNITLGVVDQTIYRKGSTAADALNETVSLAQETEKLGYTRYWVAEHHNSNSSTGNAPEILIGQIASKTRQIKVGSGGVMLQHYSALKVAEQFRMLESFYPGRIELGIGRAPGSDHLTARALAYPRTPIDIRNFPQMVSDLLGFVDGNMGDGHPFSRIKTQPGNSPDEVPEVWILGSSDFSAKLAAQLGLPFSFADFFGTTGLHGPMVTDIYRKEFKPSKYLSEPKVNVTIQVLCASTEKEARFLAASRNINKAGQYFNLMDGLISPEEATKIEIPSVAKQYIESLQPYYIDGTPDQVHEKIIAVSERYGTNNIGIVTTCYSYEYRALSYKLVSEAFGLDKIKSQ